MKKVLSIVLAVVICASMASVAMAFAPSITYKDQSDVSDIEAIALRNGEPVYSLVYQNGNLVDTLDKNELIVVPIAKIDAAENVSKQDKGLLKDIYVALAKGTMNLPYEKIEGIDRDKMVIRDLFEVTTSKSLDISAEGTTISVKFNVGVAPNAVVVAMSYVNGEWVPAVSTTVNADGSVTCVLENFGPVAISVQA